MAKLNLNSGEMMIGSGQMSIYKMWGLTKKPFQGNIFVTNQRVCFKVRMNPRLEMDLSVAEIKGFSVGKIALFTAVTIHSKSGEEYPLTGFPAKKLQDWLRQAGIQEIDAGGRAHMKHPIHIVIRNIICAALALLVLLAAPTGWLYDLWAGTGTEQGQRPSVDVQQLQQQEEIETFFLSSTPATIIGGELVACPLARLRDVSQEGVHHRSHRKRSVYISEYIFADYPLSLWERMLQGVIGGGSYNRYYLMELGDNSWLCVYFDDYLALTGTDTYPTGYVRYTTTEERRMLKRMAEDYDVDPVYVLDMYRHGKVNWTLDLGIRLAVVLVVYMGVVSVLEYWKKRRDTDE